MTRTSHKSHQTPAFPVSCLGFIDDTTLIMGGGGGPSRTGIQNKLKVCSASRNGREFKEISQHTFEPGEDAPTSLAIDHSRKEVIVGINASEQSIKAASQPHDGNKHCRVFSFSDNSSLSFVKAAQTINSSWTDDYPYQSFTVLNPTANFVAVGTIAAGSGAATISLLSVETLESRWTWKSEDDDIEGELVDIDFSLDGGMLAIATTKAVYIYSLPAIGLKSAGKGVTKLVTVKLPIFGEEPLAFRSVKFSRSADSASTFHAILNSSPKPASRGRAKGKRPTAAVQRSYCCNFARLQGQEVPGWELQNKRELGNKPVGAFEISADGKLLAYASSDYSVGLLDARTLAPLLKILHAHSFAIRALAFNPSGTLLVSAGADNSVRVIVIPASFGSSAMVTVSVLVALVLVILAILLQRT